VAAPGPIEDAAAVDIDGNPIALDEQSSPVDCGPAISSRAPVDSDEGVQQIYSRFRALSQKRMELIRSERNA
jgi:hypothetical protein